MPTTTSYAVPEPATKLMPPLPPNTRDAADPPWTASSPSPPIATTPLVARMVTLKAAPNTVSAPLLTTVPPPASTTVFVPVPVNTVAVDALFATTVFCPSPVEMVAVPDTLNRLVPLPPTSLVPEPAALKVVAPAPPTSTTPDPPLSDKVTAPVPVAARPP